MLDDPLEITLLVTETLERLGVPYMIGGSLASTLYGMVRTTQDSDIIAEMKPEHTGSFVEALQGEFFLDEKMIADSIRRRSSFNIIHRDSMFKVDVFIPPPGAYYRSELAHAQRQVLSQNPERGANFASPEDTILSKLVWYRMGGEVSERQWRDVQGILKVQGGQLDQAYMDRWAGELGISDLLDKARKESGV